MGAKRPQLADRSDLLLERLNELEKIADDVPVDAHWRRQRRKNLARAAILFASVARRYLGGHSDGR